MDLSSRATNFDQHVAERLRKNQAAMASIPDAHRLSLKTAMQLFQMKAGAVASYGISVIWDELSTAQLEKLDKVKATFLKRALGLSRNARNRLVYVLAGTVPFVEDLVRQFNLKVTPALTEFREIFSRRMRDVSQAIYESPAMTDRLSMASIKSHA